MSTTTTRRKASAAAFLSININRHFGLPFWIITKSLKMQEWLRNWQKWWKTIKEGTETAIKKGCLY